MSAVLDAVIAGPPARWASPRATRSFDGGPAHDRGVLQGQLLFGLERVESRRQQRLQAWPGPHRARSAGSGRRRRRSRPWARAIDTSSRR